MIALFLSSSVVDILSILLTRRSRSDKYLSAFIDAR